MGCSTGTAGLSWPSSWASKSLKSVFAVPDTRLLFPQSRKSTISGWDDRSLPSEALGTRLSKVARNMRLMITGN